MLSPHSTFQQQITVPHKWLYQMIVRLYSKFLAQLTVAYDYTVYSAVFNTAGSRKSLQCGVSYSVITADTPTQLVVSNDCTRYSTMFLAQLAADDLPCILSCHTKQLAVANQGTDFSSICQDSWQQ